MEMNDVYDSIPWDILKGWAASVKFDEELINPGFPKYQKWTQKAVYADYLMDFIDERFVYGTSAYIKAERLRADDVPDKDLLEVYKLFFDSSAAEDHLPDSPEQKEWIGRLEKMVKYLKERYSTARE